MADKNRDLEGRDLLLWLPEGANRAPPGVSSRSAEEPIRTTEELRQAVEELRSAARERDEELLRKILAAAQAAEPRVDSVPQNDTVSCRLEIDPPSVTVPPGGTTARPSGGGSGG